jgi:hypothetical protein
MLDRLALECQRVAVGAAAVGAWQSGCEEWQDLKEAYDAHIAGAADR